LKKLAIAGLADWTCRNKLPTLVLF